MKVEMIIYLIYVAVIFIFCTSILAVPFITFSDEELGGSLYRLFSPLCHQKISRSHCVFSGVSSYYITDCTPQRGTFVADDNRIISAERNGDTGYKFPVCSRDVGLYLAMLLGAVAYPFMRGIDNRNIPPAVYLVIALVPLGVDGGIQFISDFGILPFVYESTIRFMTGTIAGFAASVYLIPLLINLFSDSKTR